MYTPVSYQLVVPAARTTDLVITQSGDEVLVYDTAAHHIHHLNAAATSVWQRCDGHRAVADIAVETGLTEEAVQRALRTLGDAKLLDGPLADPMRGMQSRRSFMRKAAIAGVAVPAIVSISAPSASASQSGEVIVCSDDSCCTGPCKNEFNETIDSTRNNPRGSYTCIKNVKKCGSA